MSTDPAAWRQLLRTDRVQSVGEMLAGLAHQLNNPLAGVLGFTEQLLRRATEPAARSDLESILREAGRARDIVEQLARLVRTGHIERAPVDWRTVAAAVDATTAERRRLAQVELVLDLPDDGPPVAGAADRLQLALEHLVTNAIDAVAEYRGQGTVTVASHVDGAMVECTVRDDGAGLGAYALARCFDPFFTTKEPGRGLGLGLPMAQTVALEHQGELELESQLGRGTTARLRIPVWREGRHVRVSSHAPAPGRPRTALVAVASDATAARVADALDLLRWRYHVALAGGDATLLATRGGYDVAIVDTSLGDPGGLLGDVIERAPGLRGRVLRVRVDGGPDQRGAIDLPPDPEAFAVALGLALAGQAGAGW